jgi:hypothetical protein
VAADPGIVRHGPVTSSLLLCSFVCHYGRTYLMFSLCLYNHLLQPYAGNQLHLKFHTDWSRIVFGGIFYLRKVYMSVM